MNDDADADGLAEAVVGLREEVGQLRDLFRRRLVDDKSKNAVIDHLQEQSRALTDVVRRRDLELVCRETLLAVDRLLSEPASPELVRSVAQELLEVFHRRDLVEVATDGAFDARVHEIVRTVPAPDEIAANRIVEVARTGYMFGDRLLRPAQVTVAVAPGDATA